MTDEEIKNETVLSLKSMDALFSVNIISDSALKTT
jgi:hypothetical protein